MEYEIHDYDVIIIGGGLTGLRTALELSKKKLSIAIISKVHPLRSHSVAAQGGINAALGNAKGGENDNWKDHSFDTIKGSDYLADQDTVKVLCKNAPETVIELEHMGTVFSRMENNKIAQRPFGGAGFPRTCYAADRTGHNLLHTLFEQTTNRDISFYNEFYITSLLSENNGCIGCIGFNIADGSFHGFSSQAILIATGGYGRIFARSTNALINTGDGTALAYRAGVPLKDMEFIQFHPTTLYPSNILITEGARGEGGLLFNNRNERFMKEYASKAMELAPRDIVARAIQKEIDTGKGFEDEYVHLDLTHLGAEKINNRLPGIRQISIDFASVDPIKQPIPVQPGQHYSMGGIDSSIDCSTPMDGLYAAGEAACISVHGSNRLGGNSLLETIVFGKIAGITISKNIKKTKKSRKNLIKTALENEGNRVNKLISREKGEKMVSIQNDLKKIMFNHFGIFREEKKMKEGLKKIKNLQNRFNNVYIISKEKSFNFGLMHSLELNNMLLIAEAVGLGALNRKESRGSHFRTDYPNRNDTKYLAHTLAFYKNQKMELKQSPVTLGIFPVKERLY